MRGGRAWPMAQAIGRGLTFALLLAAPLVPARAVRATDPVHYSAGGTFFQANCSVCHGPHGAGQPSLAPPLTAYPASYARVPEGRRQLALTVLYGMFGSIRVGASHYDFKMPDFSRFDDATLAEVLNFVVFDLAQAPPGTEALRPGEIAAERKQALDGTAVRKHRASVLAALGLQGAN